MFTYQKFAAIASKTDAIREAITRHVASAGYKTAVVATEYDRQRNKTILEFAPCYYNAFGQKVVDKSKTNTQICSNFFSYLVNQRAAYSMGNAITLSDESDITELLGKDFPQKASKAARAALLHGVSFLYMGGTQADKRFYLFGLTEFVPLYDERDGSLRAGIRFWQVDTDSPKYAVLYEEDGYTEYSTGTSTEAAYHVEVEKRPYVVEHATSEADGEREIGAYNWGRLPIFPIYANRYHESVLIGMRATIDAYDLVNSGFANSVHDALGLLTILTGYDGYSNSEQGRQELQEVLERMRLDHIIAADADGISTQTQEPPYLAQKTCLDHLKSQIFEDFGGLDVHSVMSGATNDHIAAAYEPLNARADEFEDEISLSLRPILEMVGSDADIIFNRKPIANDSQTTADIINCYSAELLDRVTALKKLPMVDADEVDEIIGRLDEADYERYTPQGTE